MIMVRNIIYGAFFTASTTVFVYVAEAAPQHNCAAYASAAVAQNNQNKANGCGLTGGGWQSDYNAHFNWCQQQNVGIQALSSEDHARKVALQNCIGKSSFCESYAKQAVSDQINNMKYKCRFEGGPWQLNHSAHLKWCLTVRQSKAAAENAKRANALSECRTIPFGNDNKLNPVNE